MQTLTIKIKDSQNINFLIELLSKFSFVEAIETDNKKAELPTLDNISPIREASGKPSITDFAGLWQENPKTLDQIRKKAWKRNI